MKNLILAVALLTGLLTFGQDKTHHGNITIKTIPNTIVIDSFMVPDATGLLQHVKYMDVLAKLQADLTSLGGTDDQNASEVPFTPTGETTSTNVQSAIEEVQADVNAIVPVSPLTFISPLSETNDIVTIDLTNSGFLVLNTATSQTVTGNVTFDMPILFKDYITAWNGVGIADNLGVVQGGLEWDINTMKLESDGIIDINSQSGFVNVAGELSVDTNPTTPTGVGSLGFNDLRYSLASSGEPAIGKYDDGSGIGFYPVGWDRTNFAPIGWGALDLSIGDATNTTKGASGTVSMSLGYNNTASGYGAFVMGHDNTASGNYTFVNGISNITGGGGSLLLGTALDGTGGDLMALFGSANILPAGNPYSFLIGNGTYTVEADNTSTRLVPSDAFRVYRTGRIESPDFDLVKYGSDKDLTTVEKVNDMLDGFSPPSSPFHETDTLTTAFVPTIADDGRKIVWDAVQDWNNLFLDFLTTQNLPLGWKIYYKNGYEYYASDIVVTDWSGTSYDFIPAFNSGSISLDLGAWYVFEVIENNQIEWHRLISNELDERGATEMAELSDAYTYNEQVDQILVWNGGQWRNEDNVHPPTPFDTDANIDWGGMNTFYNGIGIYEMDETEQDGTAVDVTINAVDWVGKTYYMNAPSSVNYTELRINTAGWTKGSFRVLNRGSGHVFFDTTDHSHIYGASSRFITTGAMATFSPLFKSGVSPIRYDAVAHVGAKSNLSNFPFVESNLFHYSHRYHALTMDWNDTYGWYEVQTNWVMRNMQMTIPSGSYGFTYESKIFHTYIMEPGALYYQLKDSFIEEGEAFWVLNTTGAPLSITKYSGNTTYQYGTGAIPDLPDGEYMWVENIGDNYWSVRFDKDGGVGGGDVDQTISFDSGSNLMTISGSEDTADLSSLAGGATPTNLAYITASRMVTSSTGTNAVIPYANGGDDGLLSASDFSNMARKNVTSIFAQNLGVIGKLQWMTSNQIPQGESYYDETIDGIVIETNNLLRLQGSNGAQLWGNADIGLEVDGTSAVVTASGNTTTAIEYSSATSKILITKEFAELNYRNSGGEGGASSLNELSDVTLSSPANGEILKYNGSAWVDGTDDNTQLNESQVDAFVANNGYSTGAHIPNTDSQSLSINGDQLSISGGNTITVPSGGGGDGDITGVNITSGSGLSGTAVTTSGEHIQTLSVTTGGITSTHLANNTIQEVDMEISNTGVDNRFLTFNSSTGGFTWDALVGGTGITTSNQTISLGSLTSNWNASSSYTITAGGFYESSLSILKTNISPFLKSGLDLVNGLNIVTYDKKDGNVENKIGVLIDETKDEFANETHDAVDLYKTIFIQAKAIQELSDKLDELENRIKELEDE